MSEKRFSPEMMERIRRRDPEALAFVDEYVAEHGDCDESKKIRDAAYTGCVEHREYEAAVVFAANTATFEMATRFTADEADPDYDITVEKYCAYRDDLEKADIPSVDMTATGDDAVLGAIRRQSAVDSLLFEREEKLAIARHVIGRIVEAVAGKMGVSVHEILPYEADEMLVQGSPLDGFEEEAIQDVFLKSLTKIMKASEAKRTADRIRTAVLSGEFTNSNISDEHLRIAKEAMLTRVDRDFSQERVAAVAAEAAGKCAHQNWPTGEELRKRAEAQDAARRIEQERTGGFNKVTVTYHTVEGKESELSGSYSPFTITVDSTFDDKGRDLRVAMGKVVQEYPQFTIEGSELRATIDAAEDLELINEIKKRAVEIHDGWVANGMPEAKLKTLADLMRER